MCSRPAYLPLYLLILTSLPNEPLIEGKVRKLGKSPQAPHSTLAFLFALIPVESAKEAEMCGHSVRSKSPLLMDWAEVGHMRAHFFFSQAKKDTGVEETKSLGVAATCFPVVRPVSEFLTTSEFIFSKKFFEKNIVVLRGYSGITLGKIWETIHVK